MDDQRRAQAAAERFAGAKAKKYLENFLTDTRLKEVLPTLVQNLKDEHTANLLNGGPPLPYALNEESLKETMAFVFGRWIAMSFAVGYVEALENRQERRAKLKIVKPEDGPTIA